MSEASNVQEPPNGGSDQRLVRRFRVRGICFVPTDVEMEIYATSEEEAVRDALATNWKAHIGGNDGDPSSAFDWQPAAEEINPANANALAAPTENEHGN